MNRLLLILVIILTFSFKNLYCQIDTINQYYFNNLRTVLSKDPNVKKIKFIQKKISNNQGLLQTMFVKYRNDKDNRYWHVGKQFIINTSNSTLGFVRNADIRNGNITDTAFSYSPDGTIAAMQIYTTKFDSVIPMKTGFSFMSSVFGKYYENVPNTYKEITYSCDKDTIIEGIYKFSRHNKGIVIVEGFFPDGKVTYYNRKREVIKEVYYDSGVERSSNQVSFKDTLQPKNTGLNEYIQKPKIGRKIIIDNINYREVSKDSICCDDTVRVQGIFILPKNAVLPDTTNSFLATFCDKGSKFGFRFDFGFSQYVYSKSFADWLGNHQGTNLNFIFVYDKFNIGFRFKPWTTNPNSDISFDNQILSKKAEINPFKLDYYISYDLTIGEKYSIEPSLGYTQCTFKVRNTDATKNQSFNINSTDGFLMGLTFNRYARVAGFKYFSFFGRVNYGFVDYSKVHDGFGKGYLEICAGISYKFYWTNRKYYRVN